MRSPKPIFHQEMKATAVAPANIAFIKYWGQKDPKINLPFNDSLSMNLSNCQTITTVKFSPKYKKDKFLLLDKNQKPQLLLSERAQKRVVAQLKRIRKLAKVKFKAKVASFNNFPQDAGIASSASAFAALTLAAAAALGLKLSQKELSSQARLGSGSAARSIPDGFVKWQQGRDHQSSYAFSLASPSWWDLRDIVVLVSQERKKHSSLSGHLQALTSPYFKTRLKILPSRIQKVEKAIAKKNLRLLGETIEEEAIDLHVIAMTAKTPIFYWKGTTIEVIKALRAWREKQSLGAFFTLDAGANLHIICEKKKEKTLLGRLKGIPGILKTVVNYPSKGARLTEKHLF